MVTRNLLPVLVLLAACGCGGAQGASTEPDAQPVPTEAGPGEGEAGAQAVTMAAVAGAGSALEAVAGQGGAPSMPVTQGGSPGSAGSAVADVPGGAPNGGGGVAGSAGAVPALGGQSGSAASAAGGSSAGSSGVGGSSGSAGASAASFGTIVVTATVGGLQYSTLNPGTCTSYNQWGPGGDGSKVVLAYGLPGKPRDSGVFLACGNVDAQKQVPADTELSFMTRLERAWTWVDQTHTSPNYAMDPAVTFTMTVTANQTVHVAVDFPVTGVDGATFSIAP